MTISQITLQKNAQDELRMYQEAVKSHGDSMRYRARHYKTDVKHTASQEITMIRLKYHRADAKKRLKVINAKTHPKPTKESYR